MLVTHKGPFVKGLILLISFAVLVAVMLLPIFKDKDGNRMNSLRFADTVFNSLSKGSSWFIPEASRQVDALPDANVKLTVRLRKPALAPVILKALTVAGITDAYVSNGELTLDGNLKAALKAATEDSALLYDNNGAAIEARYGGEQPLRIALAWWQLFNPAIKALQRQGEIKTANVVETVLKKAIEPGNNFYGLPVARVSENIVLVCAMLAFYVLYAIWYGFGIYNLFDGFGLLGRHEGTENVANSDV